MLKSLHRSLECITLAKEFNKLKHKTMTNLTKTQKALKLLKKKDQLTIALKELRKLHEQAMGNKLSLSRLHIIEDIDDTLELLK